MDTGAPSSSGDDVELLRAHEAAGLALVRAVRDGSTKWIAWPPRNSQHSREPSITLKKKDFARNAHFQVIASADGHAPQNVLILLHGRGDNEEPFARLGAQMALPQTAAISLRAPVELPFDLGNTWYEDLDDEFEVIPPHVPHAKRSHSLNAAGRFLWTFMQTLHSKYGWKYERMFLFGFSQGACVAYHALMALAPPQTRLGGVVLVAGGFVAGPHSTTHTQAQSDAETPVLAICGARDSVYPAPLSNQTELLFTQRYKKGKALYTKFVARNKEHDMVRTQEDMLQVMKFFSSTLYLKNIELERRSDIIEIVQ